MKTRKTIERENLGLLLLNGYMTAFITKNEAEKILLQYPVSFLNCLNLQYLPSQLKENHFI